MKTIEITVNTGRRLTPEVIVPAVPFVNDADGTITPDTVLKGYRGYAKGKAVDGTLYISEAIEAAKEAGRQEVYDTQADATATEADIVLGKVAYAGTQRLVGALNLNWKDPAWWDIYAILAANTTSGYIAKFAYLFADEWRTITLQGADAYLMSDGTFYAATSTAQSITHTWAESAYKPDSKGGVTKYYIRMFKSATVALANVTIGASTNQIGGWPIYMVAKDATIPAANFPGASYVLKGYDHINCKYSGTSLMGFFGNANHNSLIHLPSDWVFTQAYTTLGNALCAPLFTKIDYSWVNFTQLGTNGGLSFAGTTACEEVTGVVDLAKQTANLTLSLINCKEIRFANVNCSLTVSADSVYSRASLLSLKAALADRRGLSQLTLALGYNGRTFTSDEIAEIQALNWIVTGIFN